MKNEDRDMWVDDVVPEVYKPKDGDTVKATLGESVLYGTVTGVWHSVVCLDAGDGGVDFELESVWHFEPWTPPVEFKPLAVVRVSDDALRFVVDKNEPLFSGLVGTYQNPSREFVRYAKSAWQQYGSQAVVVEFSDTEVARLLAAGKAEVLFAGVDPA